MGSVWSTQVKKNFSFKIGVATIFLVSSFVTVILSVAYLQQIVFFQMGQTSGSDIDIIMTSAQLIDEQVNLNYNPYSVNPFQTSDVEIISNAPNQDSHLTQKVLGLELMDT